jgi:Endonuclease/Exonuclease/phosphatase family
LSRSRLFAFLALILSVVLAALSLVNLFHIDLPPFTFLGLLSIPCLCLSAALGFISIVLQFKRVALVSVITIGLFCAGLLPWLTGRAMLDYQQGPVLRVMFAHASDDPRTSDLLRSFVMREAPDIVAILETSSQSTTPGNPFLTKAFAHSRRFGKISLYSREPLDGVISDQSLAEATGFHLSSRIGPLHLRIVDMPQTWPYGGWEDYDQALERIKPIAHSENGEATLLIGDFNSSLSSAPLLNFSQATGLKPATSPIGTWPAHMPPYLRLAIDNAFLSSQIKATHFKVGPEFASDHRPILVEIQSQQAAPEL